MSLEQLESAILALSPDERLRLIEWVDLHLAELVPSTELTISEEQKAEILRRRDAFLASPALAEPWGSTAAKIRQHLHARRAQKAAASGQ
jgi:putative addiction module component (TIGR02574 family)